MSQRSKLTKSRNQWKNKASQRAEELRYKDRELARIKEQRDLLKKELQETRKRLLQLEPRDGAVAEQNKEDLVFFGAPIVFGGAH